MAVSIFAAAASGAGLEILFANILKIVIEVGKNTVMFKPSLKRLADMLSDMHPSIQKIEAFNKSLDRPREIEGLKQLLEKGQELVVKCSRIKKYNYYKKPIYNRRILRLEESIRKFITTTLQVLQLADNKEILYEVREIAPKLDRLSNQFSSVFVDSTDISVTSSRNEIEGLCTPPKPKGQPVGLEIPLTDLKKMLLKDDQVSLIVISAPGGCGKTTLVKTLCQDPKVEGKFKDNIFFLNVSKAPNLLVIVEKLFQHLKFKLPVYQSEEDAVDQLERLLRQIKSNPILLVLDDVFPGSESLIEKLRFEIEGYSILITSRSDLRRLGSTYKLQTLNFSDALTLFHQSAFLSNEKIPDAEIVKKIVQRCKGYPLAISVTGKSLRGKPVVEWRKRLKEWSRTAAILSNSELLACLQSSVDALEDEIVKECYMDLGSFPEDQKIPAATLIDLWTELYNLDEDDAFVNLIELCGRNLLDFVAQKIASEDDDDSYYEQFVMQHDILRELAILQSNPGSIQHRKRLFLEISRNQFPEEWRESEKLLINAKLLSICTDETFTSDWYSMEAPELEVLVLNFKTENYALPQFIETMDKLKVLVVNNYGFLPTGLSNFPVISSLSYLKRMRLEKIFIPSSLTSLKLDKLEKLSLVMCNIGQAFSCSAIKISDTFPKLVEINIDYCNDLVELPAGFCDLVSLKKLRITNCHKLRQLPEEIGNLQNLEILRLNSCTELLELPPAIARLQKLKILDLSYCLSLTELPEQIGDLYSLRKLYMIECCSWDLHLPPSILKLVHLEEVIGDEEIANSWNHFKPRFPCLNVIMHKEENNLNWLR